MWRYRFACTWLDIFVVRDSASTASYTKSSAPLIAGHDFILLKLNCASSPLPPSLVRYSRRLGSVYPDNMACLLFCQATSLLPLLHPFTVILSGARAPPDSTSDSRTPDQIALDFDQLFHRTSHSHLHFYKA